jgi:hypothetical protein
MKSEDSQLILQAPYFFLLSSLFADEVLDLIPLVLLKLGALGTVVG